MNTYRNRGLADQNLAKLKEFNNLYRQSINNQLINENNKLINKSDRGRYNIWDILADFAPDIINNNILLGKVDKIYLSKMINALINNPDITGATIGLEYYCLKQIVRFPIFKTSEKLAWVYNKISDAVNYYNMNGFAKKTALMFARNVRKMEMVRKTFNSCGYYRSYWNNVFNCYSLGVKSLTEELNQTDMLNILGITINEQAVSNTVVDVENDSDDDYLLSEVDNISQPDSTDIPIGLNELDAGADDTNRKIHEVESPIESESDGVVDDIADDPEDWEN